MTEPDIVAAFLEYLAPRSIVGTFVVVTHDRRKARRWARRNGKRFSVVEHTSPRQYGIGTERVPFRVGVRLIPQAAQK